MNIIQYPLLNGDSPKIEHPDDINIQLKEHQLAIVKRCIDIESSSKFGVMSDKPGTGKTYAILALMHISNSNSLIVVPQNIIGQWCKALNIFSNGRLKYKKIIDYGDIISLYNFNDIFLEHNIFITTSLYYNLMSTTLKGTNFSFDRVIFDEVDSISSFIVDKINAKFIWFVSASFSVKDVGIYTDFMTPNDLPIITCKCEDAFIDENLKLDEPNIYKIICKNVFLDTIFNGIFSTDEYKLLNAMDFSRLKKKFCSKIAQNEKEALEYIVKDYIDIIETDKMRISDLENLIPKISFIQTERLNNINKQLDASKKSLETHEMKLNLIKERLKENNFCVLCYEEFANCESKVISKCCKNMICYKCVDTWYNTYKKTNCLYCNMENIVIDDFVVINEKEDDSCVYCNKKYESDDDKYYAECCRKVACCNCLDDWFNKLLKKQCLFCDRQDIMFHSYKNKKKHDDEMMNRQTGIKYIEKTKIEFMEFFIKTKIYSNSKVIFCSSYIRIFDNIKKILNDFNVNFIELDDGNVEAINRSVNSYTNGNMNVILLNSNLFGCGLNLECTSDIVFLHKTDPELEKQIIGRAQRLGRKNKLNVWFVYYENEVVVKGPAKKNNDFKHVNVDVDNYSLDMSIREENKSIGFNDTKYYYYERITPTTFNLDYYNNNSDDEDDNDNDDKPEII